MLVIRRRPGESLLIGDDIEIEVLDAGPTHVKLGIRAPRQVVVLRREVALTRDHNRAAVLAPGADDFPGEVRQGEDGGLGSDGEDAVLDAGGEKLLRGAFADGEALGLDEAAGLGGDLVELFLKVRHAYYSVDLDGRRISKE